jgi:hypothetical protein
MSAPTIARAAHVSTTNIMSMNRWKSLPASLLYQAQSTKLNNSILSIVNNLTLFTTEDIVLSRVLASRNNSSTSSVRRFCSSRCNVFLICYVHLCTRSVMYIYVQDKILSVLQVLHLLNHYQHHFCIKHNRQSWIIPFFLLSTILLCSQQKIYCYQEYLHHTVIHQHQVSDDFCSSRCNVFLICYVHLCTRSVMYIYVQDTILNVLQVLHLLCTFLYKISARLTA